MLVHLVLNVLVMVFSIAFLIFGMTGMGLGNFGISTLLLGFAMGGVPIIVMAFNGVRYRNEVQVRMYLYYMWITFVILVVLMIREFLFAGTSCEHMPSIFSANGQAWACGMLRYFN